MKRIFCMMLVCVLMIGMFTGCDRNTAEVSPTEAPAEANFAPETTAVASGENDPASAQPAEGSVEAQPVAVDAAAEVPVAQDKPWEEPEADAPEATPEPSQNADDGDVVPFATATPQPNASVSSYSEVSNTGLGFKFNYPTGWNLIPGRSSVCYVQPLEDGTVYPARVVVTMKKLSHKCNEKTCTTELVEYIKLLMTQYDETTFEVDENLDTNTKFMGRDAFATTYLAYDGGQEIQGYVIMTYFERYVFCFHFLCAYEDYPSFEPAMRTMRDSVKPEQTETEEED